MCNRVHNGELHYVSASLPGGEKTVIPIWIEKTDCENCQDALMGVGPYSAFEDLNLMNIWTAGLPKVYTFLATSTTDGVFTIGQDPDESNCQPGETIKYIDIDPLSVDWTAKLVNIQILNLNGPTIRLDRPADVFFDTGAVTLRLPKDIADCLIQQLTAFNVPDVVDIALTFKSYSDTDQRTITLKPELIKGLFCS